MKKTNKHSVYKEQISSLCCLAVKKQKRKRKLYGVLRPSTKLHPHKDTMSASLPRHPPRGSHNARVTQKTPARRLQNPAWPRTPIRRHQSDATKLASRWRQSKDANKTLTKTCVTQDAHKKTPIRRYKASVPNATTSLIIINLNSLPLRTIVLICIRVKQLFTEKRTEIKGVFV